MKEKKGSHSVEKTNLHSTIQTLSSHSIYFGHQSVGYNIIDGVEKLEKEVEIRISKKETRDFSETGDSTFIHFTIGANSNPISKIKDFSTLVDTIPNLRKSIAFFKLCYVDIDKKTNVKDLFYKYKDAMLKIHNEHPELKLILFTIPITRIQKGWKGFVKKLIGRAPYGYIENQKRYLFNSLLKEDLAPYLPIFDIAGIESTKPDGSLMTYSYEGADFPYMSSLYASDMGHLNEYGARIVGYKLLNFLAEVSN